MKAALAVLLAAVALAGCSDAETAEDCEAGESFDPHRLRCVDDAQVCHAWINGGAEGDEAKVTCQARSDGKAWLDIALYVGGDVHIAVRDGAGQTVHEDTVRSGQESIGLRGAAGAWTLSVDFGDAGGTGNVVLWG